MVWKWESWPVKNPEVSKTLNWTEDMILIDQEHNTIRFYWLWFSIKYLICSYCRSYSVENWITSFTKVALLHCFANVKCLSSWKWSLNKNTNRISPSKLYQNGKCANKKSPRKSKTAQTQKKCLKRNSPTALFNWDGIK